MNLTAIIDAMVRSGCSAEQLAEVVRTHEAAMERAASEKRTKDADRQRRHRLSRSVNVTNSDECDVETVSCETPFLESSSSSSYQKEPPKGGFQKGEVSEADFAAGEQAVAAMRGLRGIPDHAFTAHQSVMAALDAAGFVVAKEVGIECPEEAGRLDVVASKDGGQVAIEIDSRSPRKKSLRKLNRMDCFRIVALRRVVPSTEAYAGIHAVVGIDTVPGTAWARGSRITEAWRPSSEDVEYAKAAGLSGEQTDREVTKFIRYWIAAPGQKGVKLNWSATWQNWIDRAAGYLGVTPQAKAAAPEATITTREEWFNLLQKRAAQ